MKSATGAILVILGSVLIVATMLWSTVFVGMLLKVPGDIDTETDYEGEMTWYVDPATGRSLAAGNELEMPLGVSKDLESLDSAYTSSTAVLEEEMVFSIAGEDKAPLSFVYVVDRNNMKNIDDARAYAFSEEYGVDRSGAYYPLFPLDLNEDETYPVWKNEINAPVVASFIGEDERAGITVYSYEMTVEEERADEGYVKSFDLATEISLEDLEMQLSATGVDVDGLFALAGQVMSAEDLQEMMGYAQQPIPIDYAYSCVMEMCIEPSTGTVVDLYRNEEMLSMQLDYEGLTGLFSLLVKYQQDPVLGPEIERLSELQARVVQAEPQKVVAYEYSQTDGSVNRNMRDARDGKNLLKLVRLWLPIIMTVVGVLILVLGLALLSSARRDRRMRA